MREVAPRVPVVLASRRMPAFNLACHEFPPSIFLSAHDLAFRPWEISELFADIYGDALDVEQPLALARRTGGWPAALHLWHVARRLGAPGRPTGQLDDVHELVRSYLAREVLADVDSETLDVMRRSSVLDRITADRLDRLLGIDTAHRMLARIAEQVDLVTMSSDGGGHEGPTYTYQVILRDHLRNELRADIGLTAMRELCATAAALDRPPSRGGLQDADAGDAGAGSPAGPLDPWAGPDAADQPPRLAPEWPGTRSLQHLAHGRLARADRLLASADVASEAERPARLAAALALAALRAILDPHLPAPELHRLHDIAAQTGQPWLRRLAHAVALCRTADPRRCVEASDLAVHRRREGDDWGACLIEAALSLVLLRHGRPDLELLDHLGDEVRRLGVPALEAWARSAHALAIAERRPDGRR